MSSRWEPKRAIATNQKRAASKDAEVWMPPRGLFWSATRGASRRSDRAVPLFHVKQASTSGRPFYLTRGYVSRETPRASSPTRSDPDATTPRFSSEISNENAERRRRHTI